MKTGKDLQNKAGNCLGQRIKDAVQKPATILQKKTIVTVIDVTTFHNKSYSITKTYN